MPRLLLVDDNPSIHKIAETLLAATDIELVCLDSADAALRRVQAGEPFDVALLDTAMAGMDGWGLLAELRNHPATARMPIAMMAGVLDTVDPDRIQRAPIQGFLKKPVELRELGDRIHRLLAEPVPAPPSAVDTIPAAPLEDLVAGEDDLLVLGPEDLLLPADGPAPAPLAVEDSLELEELDLDSLRGLPDDLPAMPTTEPGALEAIEALEAIVPVEDLRPVDAWADEAWDKGLPPLPEPTRPSSDMPFLVTADELPDLGELVAAAEAPTMALDPGPPVLDAAPMDIELSLEEELDLGPPTPPPPPPDIDVSVALPAAGLGLAAAAAAAVALHPAAAEPLPAAPPPAAEAPAPTADGPAANPLLDALLKDPAAMDALAQAVAARLSDKVLKEVAWEVMPELAGRLQR